MWLEELSIHSILPKNFQLYQLHCTHISVLWNMQNPGSHKGPPIVNGWTVRLNSGWSFNQLSAQTMKSIKMVKRRQSESVFWLSTSSNGHMICSASVESYVQFHTEIFSAKLMNSLVAVKIIDDGTLGHPVYSWVAFGNRVAIFQQR